MIVEINRSFSNDFISMNEVTIEDFRSISFMIENDSDESLYKLLCSKLNHLCNAPDKFRLFLDTRIKHVDENIVFNNGSSDITINLKLWLDTFQKSLKNIRETTIIEDFIITLDYPDQMFFDNQEDIVLGCLQSLSYKDKKIEFKTLDKVEKDAILNKIPIKILKYIKEFISNNNKEIVLMESKLNLPEVKVSLFDNSAFSLIKTIYSYYSYENITELIFWLSKRIPDVTYISSRTPRDISDFVRLYETELENLEKKGN